MKPPDRSTIDSLRKKGLRPQVVACVINNRKILFLYKRKYKLWGFAQGAINNNEEFYDAVRRELAEELGREFESKCKISHLGVFGQAKIIFPKDLQGSRKLFTDEGEEVTMLGKKYFYALVLAETKYVSLHESEFEKYNWVYYAEAIKLIKSIYQQGKKDMTEDILTELYERKIIN